MHNLRIFLLHRNVMFPSWDFQFFLFKAILWTSKFATLLWLHKLEYNFECIISIVNHLAMKLGQLVDGSSYHFKFSKGCLPQILLGSFFEYLDPDIVVVNILRKCFTWFKKLDPKSRPILINQPTAIKNQIWVCGFYSFEVCT